MTFTWNPSSLFDIWQHLESHYMHLSENVEEDFFEVIPTNSCITSQQVLCLKQLLLSVQQRSNPTKRALINRTTTIPCINIRWSCARIKANHDIPKNWSQLSRHSKEPANTSRDEVYAPKYDMSYLLRSPSQIESRLFLLIRTESTQIRPTPLI